MKRWWRTSGWVIAYPLVAFLLMLAVYLIAFKATAASTLDCGPEGVPTLEGRACIDREPVVVTYGE